MPRRHLGGGHCCRNITGCHKDFSCPLQHPHCKQQGPHSDDAVNLGTDTKAAAAALTAAHHYNRYYCVLCHNIRIDSFSFD